MSVCVWGCVVCVSNRAEEESAWSSAWTWVFVWSEPDTRPGQRSEVYNHPQLAVLQPQTHRPPDQQLDRPESLVQHVPDMNVTLIQTETLIQRDMKLHTFTRIIWNAYYIQIIWFHMEICVHLRAVSHFAILKNKLEFHICLAMLCYWTSGLFKVSVLCFLKLNYDTQSHTVEFILNSIHISPKKLT